MKEKLCTSFSLKNLEHVLRFGGNSSVRAGRPLELYDRRDCCHGNAGQFVEKSRNVDRKKRNTKRCVKR